ncbi:MAG: MogA/MoaB family molybdenum cofactor biosynthesis protein [Anaerolineales bacterium]|nr:MogA/MoaB family molybdenum cofactor biosynthesis protein [Anaerolineales bacterium]
MVIRVGIITVSDRSWNGERADLSGPALETLINKTDWEVAAKALLPDQIDLIRDKLIEWSDDKALDIILTTGGTGFSPRDITPEATLAVLDRQAPGLAEVMRASSLKLTPNAMLSRAVTGIRGSTVIINLPGSPKAAVENLQAIINVLPHAIQLLHNDPAAEIGH